MKVPATPGLELNPGPVINLLSDFLREEAARAGFKRLVLGLSGGIDSAVALELAARALGPRKVTAILMPYKASSPASLKDALLCAKKLKVKTRTVEITPMIDAYFAGRPPSPHRMGNKMARERMSILFDASQELGALVVGTSNKTEILLGYGTWYGDLASALNPLGDLYKTQVRQIAQALKVPLSVRKKAPSADLVPGQTDEGDLGHEYPVLDAILYRLVDQRLPPSEVLEEGWPKRTVDFALLRLRTQQFKRRLPVIAKISERTVGPDFRYARDWGT